MHLKDLRIIYNKHTTQISNLAKMELQKFLMEAPGVMMYGRLLGSAWPTWDYLLSARLANLQVRNCRLVAWDSMLLGMGPQLQSIARQCRGSRIMRKA